MSLSNVMLFSGNANPVLAAEIAGYLNLPLGKITVDTFSDGEVLVEIDENVRGRDAYILQSICMPTNDNLMALLVMADALRRASAARVTAVIPYMGYARQDRRPRSARVPITAKVVADMIAAVHIDRVLTVDLHADQIQGFFDIPVDHLKSEAIYMKYLQKQNLKNVIFASPDVGGVKRARIYAQRFDCQLVICDKHRIKANEVAGMTIIGDVRGAEVILVDDLVDTAGTLCRAADALIKNGANSVRAICTHPVLSGDAVKNIEASAMTEVIVTDTIPLNQELSKIKVLSCAKLFSKAIRNAHEYKSIAALYVDKKR